MQLNPRTEKQRRQEADERLMMLIEEHQELYSELKKILQYEDAHCLARMGNVPLGCNAERFGELPRVDIAQFGASLLYLRGFRDGLLYLFEEIDSRITDARKRMEKQNE